MDQQKRVNLFDRWATGYDLSVRARGEFPFAGYENVLSAIAHWAAARPGMRVLDLGIGTGSLAERFVEAECDVWGIDFSVKMLERAKQRLPAVHMVQADLLQELPDELPTGFDRIVSAYVLHEFDLPVKVELLARLVRDYLALDGLLIVGDIAFSSAEERDQAHRRWKDAWDEDEDYWSYCGPHVWASSWGGAAELPGVGRLLGILSPNSSYGSALQEDLVPQEANNEDNGFSTWHGPNA